MTHNHESTEPSEEETRESEYKSIKSSQFLCHEKRCKATLDSYSTKFICKTCSEFEDPKNTTKFFCLDCISAHIRNSEEVTDQKGILVPVCEEHKRIKYFLCVTCDQKMFCVTCCLSHHKTHNYYDVIENDNKIIEVKGEIHEILDQLSLLYKRSVRISKQCKDSETKIDTATVIYSNKYISEKLQEVCLEASKSVEAEIQKIQDVHQEKKTQLSEIAESWNLIFSSIAISQNEAREILSSSSLGIAELLSKGKIAAFKRKLDCEQTQAVSNIEPLQLEKYHNNIETKSIQLQAAISELMREFLKSFFSTISKFSSLMLTI